MSLFNTAPFDHEHISRFIVAFGELFTGITIQKRSASGEVLQSYEVPIEYSPKNKWISRLREQEDLMANQVKITLPRAAFEMTDIRYAPDRKIGVNGTYAIGNINGMRGKIYAPTPYDMEFQLYIMTKDQDDAQQVVEQVIPYFNPFLTINYEILPQYQIKKDVPITLTAYQSQDTYEGSPEEQRTVTTIFTFQAQMDFFGPLFATTSVIKNVNLYFSQNPLYINPTININAKVDPITASKDDVYTIIETITEK